MFKYDSLKFNEKLYKICLSNNYNILENYIIFGKYNNFNIYIQYGIINRCILKNNFNIINILLKYNIKILLNNEYIHFKSKYEQFMEICILHNSIDVLILLNYKYFDYFEKNDKYIILLMNLYKKSAKFDNINIINCLECYYDFNNQQNFLNELLYDLCEYDSVIIFEYIIEKYKIKFDINNCINLIINYKSIQLFNFLISFNKNIIKTILHNDNDKYFKIICQNGNINFIKSCYKIDYFISQPIFWENLLIMNINFDFITFLYYKNWNIYYDDNYLFLKLSQTKNINMIKWFIKKNNMLINNQKAIINIILNLQVDILYLFEILINKIDEYLLLLSKKNFNINKSQKIIKMIEYLIFLKKNISDDLINKLCQNFSYNGNYLILQYFQNKYDINYCILECSKNNNLSINHFKLIEFLLKKSFVKINNLIDKALLNICINKQIKNYLLEVHLNLIKLFIYKSTNIYINNNTIYKITPYNYIKEYLLLIDNNIADYSIFNYCKKIKNKNDFCHICDGQIFLLNLNCIKDSDHIICKKCLEFLAKKNNYCPYCLNEINYYNILVFL